MIHSFSVDEPIMGCKYALFIVLCQLYPTMKRSLRTIRFLESLRRTRGSGFASSEDGFHLFVQRCSFADLRFNSEDTCRALCAAIGLAIRFGTFGREEGCLILSLNSGGLVVKILNRNANLDVRPSHYRNSLVEYPPG